jgi:5-formyltetrahydrofolate cyclo-ligase
LISSNADLKAALRHEALARRGEVRIDTRGTLSQRLADEGLRLARLWRTRVVSAFYPLPDEPDTLGLLEALANEGLATALPAVVSKRSPLTFRLWRLGDPVRMGMKSILEPVEHGPAVAPDLLFVPLACFDRCGRRIGYGAGFYDCTLARLRATGSVLAVGVGFAVCEVASVPDEPHDQSLDAVVTEHETIFFNKQ